MSELTDAVNIDLQTKNFNFSNSKKILKIFLAELDYVNEEDLFNVKARGIDKSILQQPGWLQHFSLFHIELKNAIEYVEIEQDLRKGILWKELTETHNRDLSQMDKNQYIQCDDTIYKYRVFLALLKEISDRFSVVVDSFKSLGFALNSYVRYKQGTVEID